MAVELKPRRAQKRIEQPLHKVPRLFRRQRCRAQISPSYRYARGSRFEITLTSWRYQDEQRISDFFVRIRLTPLSAFVLQAGGGNCESAKAVPTQSGSSILKNRSDVEPDGRRAWRRFGEGRFCRISWWDRRSRPDQAQDKRRKRRTEFPSSFWVRSNDNSSRKSLFEYQEWAESDASGC